jgi:hypothetical protein
VAVSEPFASESLQGPAGERGVSGEPGGREDPAQ